MNNKTTDSVRRAEYNDAHGPSDLDVIPANWNVLPRTATADEVDVHWFFNWSEGDMLPRPMLNPWERATIGKRVRTSDDRSPVDLPGVRRAAARSSRIRRVLLELPPLYVSVLARWAAPPVRYREPVRARFARLSAVAALTSGFEEIGGAEAFYIACERAAAPRSTDGTENFQRHHAKIKLAVIEEQAKELLVDAFARYRVAHAQLRSEEARAAARKRHMREPAISAVLAASNTNADGASAMALILGESGR